LPQPNPTIERRSDVAIDDVQFRRLDLRLIRADRALQLVRQRLLRIDLLLRNAARGNECRVAVEIEFGVAQLRLVAE